MWVLLLLFFVFVFVFLFFFCCCFFFFQAEDGIRDVAVTGVQTCALPILYEYINDNPLLYSKINFRETVEVDIVDFIISDLTDSGCIIKNLKDYYKISNLITSAVDIFFANNIYNIVPRSHHNTNVPSSMTKTYINQKIKHLQQLPQPEQKTPEWYKYRHGLITASNIYKVFASQAQVNSLIYEKCKPFVERETVHNNLQIGRAHV